MNKLFAERAKALPRATNRVEYWKPGNLTANVLDGEVVRRKRELDKEKQDVLKVLLGDQGPTASGTIVDSRTVMRAMLDVLPSDKQNRVLEAVPGYSRRTTVP